MNNGRDLTRRIRLATAISWSFDFYLSCLSLSFIAHTLSTTLSNMRVLATAVEAARATASRRVVSRSVSRAGPKFTRLRPPPDLPTDYGQQLALARDDVRARDCHPEAPVPEAR